uniref:Uncharacterized protein n=1 Tax=Arundo donax TaxID=35708 RepID=A0A0A9C952_ARUDO
MSMSCQGHSRTARRGREVAADDDHPEASA